MMRSLVMHADIFSLPFRFSVGKKSKDKHTFIGGLISIIILMISLAYFVYLCSLYFSNKIQPNIIKTNEITSDSYQMHLDGDFIMTQFITPDGKTLDEFQADGLIYVMSFLTYSYLDEFGQKKSHEIQHQTCLDPTYSKMMCYDLSKIGKTGYDLIFELDQKNSLIQIQLTECIADYLKAGEICHPNIDSVRFALIQFGSTPSLSLKLKQFNPKTKQFDQLYIKQEFFFDELHSFTSLIRLKKADVAVTQGFILQSTETIEIISDFSRQDGSYDSNLMQNSNNLWIFGWIVISLSQEKENIYVVYPQFTQLLSMFQSMFSSLLLIGVICKILAEQEIAQEFVSLYLQVYYKKAAVILLGKQEENQISKRNDFSDAEGQKYDEETDKQIDLLLKIQSINLANQVKKVSKVNFFKRICFFFSPPKPKTSEKDIDPYEVQLYKDIYQTSTNENDVFSIKRELLQLKMMIRMLVTPEQFAALQLCGSSVRLPSFESQKPTETINESSAKFVDESAQSANEVHENQNLKIIMAPCNTQHLQYTNSQDVVLELQNNLNKQNKIEDHKAAMNCTYPTTTNTNLNQLNHLEVLDQMENDIMMIKDNFKRFMNPQSNRPISDLDNRIRDCLIVQRVVPPPHCSQHVPSNDITLDNRIHQKLENPIQRNQL